MLFQHAISHLREELSKDEETERSVRTILFVTVSAKLQQELKRRYKDVKDIATHTFLPQIAFFSLKELLQYLLDSNGVQKNTAQTCSYLHFAHERSRKSHQRKFAVEPT